MLKAQEIANYVTEELEKNPNNSAITTSSPSKVKSRRDTTETKSTEWCARSPPK